MKKLVLLVMVGIALYSCKDEERPIQQEEEVIEEINYYVTSGDYGLYCDSLYLKKETTKAVLKKTCDGEAIYSDTFINDEVKSFVDTIISNSSTFSIVDDFNSISNYLDSINFFELSDTVTFLTPADGPKSWVLDIKTNKRSKLIIITPNYTNQNLIIEELVQRLENFRNYHQSRIANLLGN